METLQNKIAVVLGGTGGVGEGIVKSLLSAGATVVVPTRTEYKMRKLKSYIGDELGKKSSKRWPRKLTKSTSRYLNSSLDR